MNETEPGLVIFDVTPDSGFPSVPIPHGWTSLSQWLLSASPIKF